MSIQFPETKLRPMPSSPAMGAAISQAPPQPPLTEPNPPWYNKLGERLMQIAEDPRNQWIGMGPMAGMAKIPKLAKEVGGAVLSVSERIARAKTPMMMSATTKDGKPLIKIPDALIKKHDLKYLGAELPEDAAEGLHYFDVTPRQMSKLERDGIIEFADEQGNIVTFRLD